MGQGYQLKEHFGKREAMTHLPYQGGSAWGLPALTLYVPGQVLSGFYLYQLLHGPTQISELSLLLCGRGLRGSQHPGSRWRVRMEAADLARPVPRCSATHGSLTWAVCGLSAGKPGETGTLLQKESASMTLKLSDTILVSQGLFLFWVLFCFFVLFLLFCKYTTVF